MIDRSPPGISSDPLSKNFYRRDIDGLRALAVLPVILFHSNFLFPGGFIGVDVFFVISGYLITQIIERELKVHRFSVLVFYQRRIRRIFPALFVMFAVSTLIAYIVLLPSELKDFGKSLVASSAFSSNILFYQWSGYFAPNSESVPLLHTWTLSVEEQFYLCWPLLLGVFSIRAAVKWKVPASLAVLLATLMLSAHWVNTKPNAAFYLLPSRAWELALGALLCFQPVSGALARLPRTVASIASLAGICLLGTTVIAYDKLTPFPGFAALLPCMGAALIIAAGEGGPSIGGKILSLRPLVWIGLISYSLYLWHWPILVFGPLIANHKLDAVERGSLVVLTFIVAWLSWRFVESPFRKAHVVRSRSRVWVIGGLLTSVVFVAVGFIFMRDGLPARGLDVGSFVKEVATDEKLFQESPCLARGASLPATEGCLLGAPSPASRYEVVLWGDSHATHLAPALNEIGQRLGVTSREITKAGCSPIPGVRILPVNGMTVGCQAFNDAALRAVLAEKHVRVVVLAARWDAFADGTLLLTPDGARPKFRDSRQLFISSLRKLLTTLVDSGRQVIIVGQVPLPPSDLIGCITRARFRGVDGNGCAKNQSRSSEQTAYPNRPVADTEYLVNQTLLEAVSHLESRVQIVHPYEYLCPNQECIVEVKGRLLYMDETHLSYNGVRLLEPSLEKSITSALIATKKTSNGADR
ncbi:MAG: acyltransferase family protein [Bryobacteraceae bacterium]